MADITKLKKAPYMSKRMVILKDSCETLGIRLEYLFGLFNYYNEKNKGRWFWQKANFSGALKDSYDNFNKSVDKFIKELKSADEAIYDAKISSLSDELNDLMTKMELSLNVNRDLDMAMVIGYLDNNLRALINDGLKGMV